MTDFPDWIQPQALVSARSAVGAATGQLIGAGGNTPLGPFPLAQIGYDIAFSFLANVASLYPFVTVQLVFSDQATGIVTKQVTYNLGCAASPNNQSYTLTGPSSGDTLTVTVVNNDTVNGIAYNYVIAQNSRVYVDHGCEQVTYLALPGFTNGNSDLPAGFVIQTAATINAGQFATRILPFYFGVVSIWVTSTQPIDVVITAIDRGITAAPGGNQIYERQITAAGGGLFSDVLSLPRSQCAVSVTNNGAAAAAPGVTITVRRQQS